LALGFTASGAWIRWRSRAAIWSHLSADAIAPALVLNARHRRANRIHLADFLANPLALRLHRSEQ